MRTKRKQRNDNYNLIIDHSEIKVSFEELFYDLIFIIVISKISMLLVESDNITIFSFLAIFGLFIIMVWSWLARLIHNNQVHIMSNRFGDRVANIKKVTYIEVLLLILVIHNFNDITLPFILTVFSIVMLATILTMSQVRSFLVNYFADDREKFVTIIQKLRNRQTSVVNIDYVCERYGVIIILFLGEILATVFTNVNSTMTLLYIVLLIIIMFNDLSNILKQIPDSLNNNSKVVKQYMALRSRFILILIILLSIIVSVDYSFHHHVIYSVVIFILLLTYQAIIINLKKVFQFKVDWFVVLYFITISILVLFIGNLSLILNICLLLLPVIWFRLVIKKA